MIRTTSIGMMVLLLSVALFGALSGFAAGASVQYEAEFESADLRAIDGFSSHSMLISWWYSASRIDGEMTYKALSPARFESAVTYRYPDDGNLGRLALQMRQPTDISSYEGFEIHLRSDSPAEVGLDLNLTCDEVKNAFMELDSTIQCGIDSVAVRVPFSSFVMKDGTSAQETRSADLPGFDCFMELVFLVQDEHLVLTIESVHVYRTSEQESDAVPHAALAKPGADGYAVILNVDDHPGDNDIITGYANRNRIVDALLAKGWAEENMYILLDLDVTAEAVEQAMDWLMERVTEEDLVFVYACGHGDHLRETVGLGWAFPPLWRALPTDRKVFVVNSCNAGLITASAMYGEFIEPAQRAEHSDQLASGLAIAGCAYDESGISGSIGEGLPILGGYMTFFLHGALNDFALDANGDCFVSVEETFAGTYSRARAFYANEITKVLSYPNLSEAVLGPLRAMVAYDYPHPELIDAYPGELILDLAYYVDEPSAHTHGESQSAEAQVDLRSIEGIYLPGFEYMGMPAAERYPDAEDLALARTVWDLQAWKGQLYIGSGYSGNSGPAANSGPVDVWFFDPDSGLLAASFTVDEEQIDRYCVLPDGLYIPGHDATESWDYGNIYAARGSGWQKLRTLPNAVHVYDIAAFEGLIIAVGANLVRTEDGLYGGGAWYISSDYGETWQVGLTPNTGYSSDIAFNEERPDVVRFTELFELDGHLYASGWQMPRIYQFADGSFVYVDANPFPGLSSSEGIPCQQLPPTASGFMMDDTEEADWIEIAMRNEPCLSARVASNVLFNGELIYIGAQTTGDHDWRSFGLYAARRMEDGFIRQVFPPDPSEQLRDLLVVEDRLLLLAAIELEDGDWETRIYSTKDLGEWSVLRQFTSDASGFSIEELDGFVYLGLGGDATSSGGVYRFDPHVPQ